MSKWNRSEHLEMWRCSGFDDSGASVLSVSQETMQYINFGMIQLLQLFIIITAQCNT